MSQPTTRAKFRCNTVEMSATEPQPVLQRLPGGGYEPSHEMTWPRTYRFSPQYDHSIPEDRRYAKYTPIGELRIQVDNPNVSFEPGKDYYLDFTPVDEV
ncbi:hypothetical protein AB0O28_18695 [Microbispora sp. NPDC088329]|uniref:hypothetical protein n=1 Tax=Microbispora sp. NPDC088329 TaxID=3154869 RepID=UPI003419DBE0